MLIASSIAMLAVLPAQVLSADYVPPPQACPSDLVVGCYYFPGHFNPMRWMPFRRCGFPIPVLGFYRDGEPEVSDWHIRWAVEHGISFFAFDWYYHYEHGESREHNRALNEGFLRARYRDRMKFCMMWCNENRDERYTEGHMLKLATVLAGQYFRQPNPLRIDGDNVLIISVPEYFLRSFGVEGTARVFEKMSAIMRAAGCGGLYPVAKGHDDQPRLKQAGFRAITAYNYPEAGMTEAQRKAERAPYADMVRGCEEIWKQVTAQHVLPYIVPVSPGWDSRPWYGEHTLVRTDPRPDLFREMCRAARRYVDPRLRMVIAECWNEFGEGSYVEPTAKYGFAYLDAMREAFCRADGPHDDLVPLSIGRTAPVFAPIPEPAEALMEAGRNMLYNGDMEAQWGWVQYSGERALTEGNAHGGERCLVAPAGRGVKSEWLMPVPKDRRVQISLWYRAPAGSTLMATTALFQGDRWLGRYADIATVGPTAGAWNRFEHALRIDDAEASRFDIEFIATGSDCRIDDIDVRTASSR
jgi:hypothetical protein